MTARARICEIAMANAGDAVCKLDYFEVRQSTPELISFLSEKGMSRCNPKYASR